MNTFIQIHINKYNVRVILTQPESEAYADSNPKVFNQIISKSVLVNMN